MLVLNEYQLNEYVASIGKLNINFVHFSYNYYLNTFFPTMSTIASLAYLVPVAVAIHATLIDKENGLEIVSSWRSWAIQDSATRTYIILSGVAAVCSAYHGTMVP